MFQALGKGLAEFVVVEEELLVPGIDYGDTNLEFIFPLQGVHPFIFRGRLRHSTVAVS